MKKIINLLTILILMVSFITGVQAQDNKPVLTQLWTLEQVRAMAKEYNFQDSISWTHRNVLMCMPKDKIIVYFKRENDNSLAKKELQMFSEKTKYVRSYQDYYKLVESYPAVRKLVVKTYGDEVTYQKQKGAAIKGTYRIYRTSSGGLQFVEASSKITDKEQKMGQRIDNLPKTQ